MALQIVSPAEVKDLTSEVVDDKTRAQASVILTDVRENGEEGFLRQARKLGDLGEGDTSFVVGREGLKAAYDGLPEGQRQLLQRTAARIRAFAEAQRASVKECSLPCPGGMAGQAIAAVETAGCYAPGGRYPLPSSVLMTAITARVAGVATVWVASPHPLPVTLAAAHVADADALLSVGGAQAIGALAYGLGTTVPACDVIVGPGNRWVTAAKQLVSGRVAIDMLAGPSELLVLAEAGAADPAVVAADLLAQAEHDTDARPIIVTTDRALAEAVSAEVATQLETLPTAGVAREAVKRGFAVVAGSKEEAYEVCNRIAPEHLEVMTADSKTDAAQLKHYGGLFIGPRSAEVFGDYGAGPNHVLPTQGTARYTGGLSVFTFLRVRTWLRIDDEAASQQVVRDSVELARIEGLEGHARSAEKRLSEKDPRETKKARTA